MARNDYNFEMEDVAEDVQSPQEKVASSVENKDDNITQMIPPVALK